MSIDDMRYYQKRLAEERSRAEVEDCPHLRSVHEQFVRAIEWKLRGLRKTISPSQGPRVEARINGDEQAAQ